MMKVVRGTSFPLPLVCLLPPWKVETDFFNRFRVSGVVPVHREGTLDELTGDQLPWGLRRQCPPYQFVYQLKTRGLPTGGLTNSHRGRARTCIGIKKKVKKLWYQKYCVTKNIFIELKILSTSVEKKIDTQYTNFICLLLFRVRSLA